MVRTLRRKVVFVNLDSFDHVGASEMEVMRLQRSPSWAEPCGKSFGTPKSNGTELILDHSGHVLEVSASIKPGG